MADLDHRHVRPPYLRPVSETPLATETSVFVWDLRVGQPNVSFLDMRAVHSVEHFLGVLLRNANQDRVISVAPMGCQTGFYIVTTIGAFAELADLLVNALEQIGDADSVPLAYEKSCGWAENHSLVGAQRVASWLLSHRDEWSDPGTTRLAGE